jgi:hypothetical protein
MVLNRHRARTGNTEQGVAVLVHFNTVQWYALTVTNATGTCKFVMLEMTSNCSVNVGARAGYWGR